MMFLNASVVAEWTKKVIYHFFHLSDEGSPNNKKEKSVKMNTKAI